MTPSSPAESISFSLVDGGLFHGLLRRMGLRRHDRWDVFRQSLALVALTEVPLLAIALVERLVSGRWDALLRDFAVHTRPLLAIPLLLWSEARLHTLSGLCIDRFVRGHFACDGELAVQPIIARAGRLRDSRAAELVLVASVVLLSQVLFWSRGAAALPGAMTFDRTAAAGWHGLVVLPVAQFILARWLWRWMIWSQLMWRLSRLRLHLDPMHPDRQGGIAFLSEPVLGLAPGLAAISAVQSGTWATRAVLEATSIRAFAGTFSAMLIVGVVLAFGPLVVWSAPLWRAYLQGESDYTQLASEYVRRFHDKWIVDRTHGEILGTSDIQSLADIGNSFTVIRGMRMLPFDGRWCIVVIASMVAPVIPLVLREVPLVEILRKLAPGILG